MGMMASKATTEKRKAFSDFTGIFSSFILCVRGVQA
jgi:hypothetical protein